ncbi:sulfotransferase 1C2-like [Uloborus diversus]|uniref:sulfotransferase 1C2-like n=1 Tax=Uloborus diversus TaxID=327109 RepID=UPI00240A80BB|nr:sulfotransferase 1C2-like [Uloborus diversus]XP_054709994.1 sulfotransferase 1C2-like [Uloborus diversus]
MYATSIVAEKHARSFEVCGCKCCQNRAMALVASKEKREKKILPEYQDTRCGFPIAKMFSIDAFESALNYRPRPDDLFIVTYPKCGTTWVQNIVACIFREGKPFESALEFLSNTPFLEMAGAEAAETMQRPGAIKLHLPFQYTPWSDQAKYIFVARNPKDCCVSFYHHTRNMVGYKFKNGSFDDYFELFMQGKVDFGDYFDCLLSWYEHRNDPNVLFITYEQLKKDTRANILRIASFMGGKYKDMLENDEKMLEAVLKYSSFDFMKETLNKQVAELATLPRDYVQNHPDIPQGLKTILGAGDNFFDSDPNAVSFVRRGIVGDWKNHFSADQNRRLEEKFKERTRGTDIPELWKDDM